MNKEFLHMQKLAGLITESRYKQLIENIENLSPAEKKIADDIVNTGMLEESKFDLKAILDKMVSYGKKGLLTLAIISSVLTSCNVTPKDMIDIDKEQYELAVKMAKEESIEAAKQGKTFNTDSAATSHYFSMQDRFLNLAKK
jgi:hypothetical protein